MTGPSLRRNFAWAFLGSAVLAASQFAIQIAIASCDIDKTALPASDHATFLRRDGALMLAGEHSRWRRAARVSRPSTYACAS